VTTTSAPAPATPSRSRRVIAISLAIIAALVVAFFIFANLYADWQWYAQLGFQSVLLTQWIARVVMFLVGFIGMALPVWLAIQLAYRLRPVYARLSSQLDRYQEVVEPLRRLAMWGIPIFFGFFSGFAASAQWETTWLWFNGVATKTTDPQFHLDTGFYLFAMPFYSALLGFISAVLLVCLLVTALVAYLYGSVRIGQRELRISKAARIQLAVIAGLYLLVQGASLWLDRYKTLVEPGDRMTGPGYTGVNAIIPGMTILAVVAVIVAILFFVTAIIGRWRYPLIATALLVVSAIVVGVGYPWVVNTFQVRPNQYALESEYYQRGIDMTQSRLRHRRPREERLQATTDAQPASCAKTRDDRADPHHGPAVISPTVRQLEQFRSYYQFRIRSTSTATRSTAVAGHVVVGARAEHGSARARASWQNTTLVYTHGYGSSAAKGNDRTTDGDPVFLERGIPATASCPIRRTSSRACTSASTRAVLDRRRAEGTDPIELDYPSGRAGRPRRRRRSTGDGGRASATSSTADLRAEVPVRADPLLGLRQRRTPRSSTTATRASACRRPRRTSSSTATRTRAWSTAHRLDHRRLHAQRELPVLDTVSLQQAISDSNTTAQRFALDDINYIRNSVKATVDAYDGSVTLYAWDDGRPDAAGRGRTSTLRRVKPISDMSADLMSHVRYPTDLFKGAARHARRVPRRQRAVVLPARQRVGDPERSADRRTSAAAVLPDDADARAEGAGVLDVHDVHPVVRGQQQPQRADGIPGRRLECRQQGRCEEQGVRHAAHAADRRGLDDSGSGSGAEHVQLRPGDLVADQPA
jgi:uncharacterized membrane protein (UPF0182 family)